MAGWSSAAAACASRTRRLRAAASPSRLAATNLIATSRRRAVSWARYTVPMPPAPSGRIRRYLELGSSASGAIEEPRRIVLGNRRRLTAATGRNQRQHLSKDDRRKEKGRKWSPLARFP